MAMTRKNYQAFADMMAELKPEFNANKKYEKGARYAMYFEIMQGMCSVFEEDNPRFDSHRFAKWVGEKSTTITSG